MISDEVKKKFLKETLLELSNLQERMADLIADTAVDLKNDGVNMRYIRRVEMMETVFHTAAAVTTRLATIFNEKGEACVRVNNEISKSRG